MTMRTIACLLAALLAALTLSATAGAAPSASSWRSRASAICNRFDKEADKLRPPDTLAELARQLPKLRALGRKERDAIASLPRPAAQRAAIAEFVKGFDPVIAIVDLMIIAARKSDAKTLNALLLQGEKLSKRHDVLAKALGATGCVSG